MAGPLGAGYDGTMFKATLTIDGREVTDDEAIALIEEDITRQVIVDVARRVRERLSATLCPVHGMPPAGLIVRVEGEEIGVKSDDCCDEMAKAVEAASNAALTEREPTTLDEDLAELATIVETYRDGSYSHSDFVASVLCLLEVVPEDRVDALMAAVPAEEVEAFVRVASDDSDEGLRSEFGSDIPVSDAALARFTAWKARRP